MPGAITLNGQAIDITKIDIPCFAIAAKADHIVPWQNAFNSANLFSGPVTFALTDSGHVAGMINHPDKNKYSYWINKLNFKEYSTCEDWLDKVEEVPGSWWLYWDEWAKKHSGELIDAQDPEMVNSNIIEDAPGSYVRIKY
jgi:polyhydroxyalkanoate synthase